MASASPKASSTRGAMGSISLESVREELIRMEDTIVFSLIERAKHPYNAPAYDPAYCGGRSLIDLFVREAEALHAKTGRYQNPEEVPFFPDELPRPLTPSYNYPHVLHPTAASANACKAIWDMYFNDLLPLITEKGDDGNYASTVALDLVCLQALCRRIHYGKFVAEVKYRGDPDAYGALIRAEDRDALMKLLTFEIVEERVKRRVEKKAMVFGQNVTLENKDDKVDNNCSDKTKYKIDPSVLSRLYGDWVMPLTKLVEVDYLLLRLD